MTPENSRMLYKRAFKTATRLLICLVCLLSLGFNAGRANAQSQPLMFLSPNSVTYYLNGAASGLNVDLTVQNVVNMQVYEFVLSYDPSLLEFVGVTPGTWFTPIFKVYSEVNPGRIHYSYAKLGAPPISGGGVLLTIKFKAIEYGSTQLDFSEPSSCKYSDNLGNQTRFTVQGGSVTTTFDPTVVANSTVAGTFNLQGQTATGGIPLTLDEGQYLDLGPFFGVSLNQNGINLSIYPVVMDIYTVTTQQAGYLNIDPGCGKTKAIFGTTTTLSPLKLIGGNAIWTNNEIDIHDLSLVSGEIGNASFNSDADINADGKVDIFDLALVAGNYGMTSSLAYADWTP